MSLHNVKKQEKMDTTTTITSASATSSSYSNNGGESSIILRKNGIKFENPFSIKVFQVFTGFGFGCGLGIGYGYPMNLGAIPVLNEVMRAASGATHAFSGVRRHVNTSLKKIGAKNIEVGVGCGVGFGHGFGLGVALKPGVMHQIQLYVMGAMTKMLTRVGAAPDFSIPQGLLPTPLQSGLNVVQGSSKDTLGTVADLRKNAPSLMSQGTSRDGNVDLGLGGIALNGAPLNLSGTRTEKLINGLLKNPAITEDSELHATDTELQAENRILQMVVKHQQVIEELLEENERLHRILIEDLKVPPNKLQSRYSGRGKSACEDCFECRRKQKRR